MIASGPDRRVLFFGDSIVAGVGDPEGLGWVGRVVAANWAAGTGLTAYPLGVRRETSVQIAARWRREALPRIEPSAVTRVVFSFGVNDTTMEDRCERVGPEASAAVLAQVLDEAARLDLPALVVGPAPVADVAQTARVARLSERFAGVCAQRAVPFVSVVAALAQTSPWIAESRAGDGAHPGAGGYAALARLVLDGGWLDWIR
jgi:acyl-CoA thioesterase-1